MEGQKGKFKLRRGGASRATPLQHARGSETWGASANASLTRTPTCVGCVTTGASTQRLCMGCETSRDPCVQMAQAVSADVSYMVPI